MSSLFQPGDIVIHYRRKYRGPIAYLLTRLICFFTTEWWKNEPTSKVYHAEMVYSPADDIEDVKDISQEWPTVRITRFGKLNRKAVFRLKHKPANFDSLFQEYCLKTLGQPYDWPKLIAMTLYWLFRGNSIARFFVNLFGSRKRDICSEYVAKFYHSYVGVPCSPVKPGYTTPDDILDWCKSKPDVFECIVDNPIV